MFVNAIFPVINHMQLLEIILLLYGWGISRRPFLYANSILKTHLYIIFLHKTDVRMIKINHFQFKFLEFLWEDRKQSLLKILKLKPIYCLLSVLNKLKLYNSPGSNFRLKVKTLLILKLKKENKFTIWESRIKSLSILQCFKKSVWKEIIIYGI